LLGLVPADVRMVTIEDTAELVPLVPNHLQLYGTAEETLDAVVKEGFRSAGQCLPVGEIRDGKTAMQALKLWLAVGGGLATIHADSARDALTRLAYLCQEVAPGTYDALIGSVVDWVVYVETVAGRRHITDVLQVDWKEEAYVLARVAQ
jgi:Flp pilus assembly CpaF family ATPase